MLDKIKKFFSKQPELKVEQEPSSVEQSKKVREPKLKKELSEKEKATENNEPYVSITKIELNPDNVHDGAFDLDWNDKFIINLVKAGYKIRPDDTDEVIADRWLQQICRTIALEMYEGTQSDPETRDVRYQLHKKKLDNGRTEVS